LRAQILGSERESRRLGLPMVHDAGVDPQIVEAYRELIDSGALETRRYVRLRGALDELRPHFGKGPAVDGNHRLTVRAIKITADGALGSRGAALLEPYADEPDTTGLLVTPVDELYGQTLA